MSQVVTTTATSIPAFPEPSTLSPSSLSLSSTSTGPPTASSSSGNDGGNADGSGGGSSSNSSPPISRSSSLLFGFLITFLALFVGFMACGYSSRRAAHMRRSGAGADAQLAGCHRSARMKKPHIWDVWVAERPGKEEWKNMMPLSVSLLRPQADGKHSLSEEETASSPPALRERERDPLQEYVGSFLAGTPTGLGRLSNAPPSPPPPPPASHARRSTPRLISEPSIASFVHPSSEPGSSSWFASRARSRNGNQRSEDAVAADAAAAAATTAKDGIGSTKNSDTHAQVAVLIAMPSPTTPISSPSREAQEEDEPRGDYEIGVTRVQLHGVE